jgi:hypothetical protein
MTLCSGTPAAPRARRRFVPGASTSGPSAIRDRWCPRNLSRDRGSPGRRVWLRHPDTRGGLRATASRTPLEGGDSRTFGNPRDRVSTLLRAKNPFLPGPNVDPISPAGRRDWLCSGSPVGPVAAPTPRGRRRWPAHDPTPEIDTGCREPGGNFETLAEPFRPKDLVPTVPRYALPTSRKSNFINHL